MFGITFEQKRNDVRIDDSALENIVTESKELGDEARLNLITALITLKYTQSNSVCFAYDGQAIGVGAGQQSRIHCTRLAGDKADTWFLRQSDRVLQLPFRAELGRAERDNIIDGYINKYEEDVCAEGIWQKYFTKDRSLLQMSSRELTLIQSKARLLPRMLSSHLQTALKERLKAVFHTLQSRAAQSEMIWLYSAQTDII